MHLAPCPWWPHPQEACPPHLALPHPRTPPEGPRPALPLLSRGPNPHRAQPPPRIRHCRTHVPGPAPCTTRAPETCSSMARQGPLGAARQLQGAPSHPLWSTPVGDGAMAWDDGGMAWDDGGMAWDNRGMAWHGMMGALDRPLCGLPPLFPVALIPPHPTLPRLIITAVFGAVTHRHCVPCWHALRTPQHPSIVST